jgi:leucyl-tRNA synthetase
MSRIHYKELKGISLLARDLRNNQTPSEKLLWEILRRKSLFGYKFLRQHPIFYRIDKNWIDFYIADFYSARLMLIIELDGVSHEGREDYDSDRDERLMSKGLRVVRIKNEELEDINFVISKLIGIIRNRTSELKDDKMITPLPLFFKGRGWGKG